MKLYLLYVQNLIYVFLQHKFSFLTDSGPETSTFWLGSHILLIVLGHSSVNKIE